MMGYHLSKTLLAEVHEVLSNHDKSTINAVNRGLVWKDMSR